jgi:hypothetical protein
MRKYSFDLHFRLATSDEDPESHLGRLLEEECDDATVGIGRRGHIGFMFTREAPTAREAVTSAIAAVKRAIPGATLVEASPDFVGLTDAAEVLGFSRQNMRQLVYSCDDSAPVPVHSGRPTLWHLADLLTWLREQKQYPVSDDLIELAETNRQVNLFIGISRELPAVQEEIRSALA